MKEYKRWQVDTTQNALKNRRVVAISGARQTGKTTITMQINGNNGVFRNLDDASMLKAAMDDPKEFVKNLSDKTTMIIDEIQKAPSLIPEIKLAVDKNNRPGQYLITGSANIQTLARISDSLAGRIKHIRLRPLAAGEILGIKPAFLQCAFSGKFPMQIKGYGKRAIFELAFKGGYPEALRINEKGRREWHIDYLDSLITKDLMEIENVRRLDSVRDLLKIMAGWSSKYIDKNKITSSLEVARPTLETYLNALESLFILERVAPWVKTDYELVGKRSKIYMTDTGLMASLLKWKKEDLTLDSDRSGKLMETFVFQELAAQIDLDSDYSLYQYRDAKKREIDFLVEKEGEGIIGIEVKASSSVSKSDFAPQIWFKENIIKGKTPFRGIILYTGENTLSFGDGMIAVPLAALWTEARF
jgi:predicted AAA+ superfamily ATPase